MNVSPWRLRAGIILLFLWWIPFWLATPFFAVIFSIDTPKATGYLTLTIMAIQTVLGLVGLFLTGTTIANIVRQASFKQVPKIVWHILLRGQFDNPKRAVVKKS